MKNQAPISLKEYKEFLAWFLEFSFSENKEKTGFSQRQIKLILFYFKKTSKNYKKDAIK